MNSTQASSTIPQSNQPNPFTNLVEKAKQDSDFRDSFMKRVQNGEFNDLASKYGYDLTPLMKKPVVPTQTQEQKPSVLDAVGAVSSFLPNAPIKGITPETMKNIGGTIIDSLKKTAQETLQTGRDIGERALAGKQSIPETALQTLGMGAEAAGKAVFGTAFDVIKSRLPQGVKDTIKGILGDAAAQAKPTIDAFASSKVGQALADHFQKNPNEAADAKAMFDILSTFYGAGAGQKAVEKTLPTVEKGISAIEESAGKISSTMTSKIAQKETDNVWKMIQPELSKTEQAAAVKAGKIVESGPLKTLTQIPNARDKAMIEAATPYVSKAKNEIEAVANMEQGIADSAAKVREGLKRSTAIWNKNELAGEINKIPMPITVKSDITLRNTFNNFKNAVLDLADKADKKAIGILDTRQELDRLIKSEFGPAIYDKTNPMSNVIRSFRKTLNTFAESKLPEGKLPDGSTFSGELKKQTLLYDAVDNTASKTGKIGTNILDAWIKANPTKARAIGYGLAGIGAERALKGVGVPLP